MISRHYYCEKTEILTKDGFKFIKELQLNDLIAVIDKNRFLEYRPIKYITSSNFTGDMIHFVNNGIDISVKPGHKLYIGNKTQSGDIEASTNTQLHEYIIQKTIGWNSSDLYKSCDFVSLLGYLHGTGRIVERYIIIDNIYRDTNLYDLLFRLPFEWRSINRDSVLIDDFLFREYVLRFHYKNNKFVIPEKLRMTSSRQISLFLQSFFGKHWGIYSTPNLDYISSIQELVAKIGGNSEIYKRWDNCFYLINNNGLDLNYPKPILQRKYSAVLYKIHTQSNETEELMYIRKNGKAFLGYM
jgi:hypothetical protein